MTDERTYDETGADRRMADRRRPGGPTVAEPVSDRTQADTTYRTPSEPARPETAPIESHRTSRQTELWPDMAQYRQRFDELQSRFIEDPRQAVRDAEKLVEEAIERLSSSMRQRMQTMHRDAESGDTEKLRMEMKSLRDFIESMGGRRTV